MARRYLKKLLNRVEAPQPIYNTVREVVKNTEETLRNHVQSIHTSWISTSRNSLGPIILKEQTRRCEKLTKRLRHERNQRQARAREREERRQAALRSQSMEEDKLKTQVAAEQQEAVRQCLLEAKERRLKQRAEIKEIIRSGRLKSKQVMSSVPLYQKLERDYPGFSPARRSPDSHASPPKSVQEFLNNLPKSQAWKNVVEEDRMRELSAYEAQQRKAKLLNRKRQYSEVVKVIFQPKAHPRKQRELQQLVQSLKHQPKRLRSSSQSFLYPRAIKLKAPQPQTFLKNVPKREFKKIDYLPELHARRHSIHNVASQDTILNSSLPHEAKSRRLKSLAHLLEQQAFKEEAKYTGVHNKNSFASLSKASSMLVDSIKAKLSVLST